MRPPDATTIIPDENPRFPLRLVLAAAAISVGMVIWDAWADHEERVCHTIDVDRATSAAAVAARILHLDEVLTMSARMAAVTGDKAWIDRYRQFEPELDRLIQEAQSMMPAAEGLGNASATEKANEALVRMEKASFELVLQGKRDDAWAMLTGPEYERQKQIYAAGMAAFGKGIETQRQNESASQRRSILVSRIAQGVVTILLLGLWCFALRRIALGWRSKVDQHRALADSLRVSEHRYRALFECSRDALMTLAPPSWMFTSANPATLELFGVKDLAELTALGPWDLSPETQPDGRPSAEKAKEMIETTIREGSQFFEWTHKRIDGGEFPATVLLTRMEYAGKAVLQATVRDITEQKRAEEERRKALRRQQGISLLQQSLLAPAPFEDKLKAITDGVVQIFGADFCRMWLVRPGDLCERGCMHAEVHEGPHACRHRDRCLHLLASSGRYTHTNGKAHTRVPFGCYKIGRVASDQEHKFLTNDVVRDPRVHDQEWAKELGLVSFAGYQLRVPGGQTIGVLALFAKHPISAEEDAMLDILCNTVARVAQQAAAEEAVHQARTEAEQANAAKSRFLANMSHEIRTPMTAILGFAEMLSSSIECCTTCPEHKTCPTRAQNKESIQVIHRNGEHLLGLVNDILDLSKIEAGKMEIDRVPCSPVQVVEEAVSLMRVRAVEKSLSLDARYEFPLPETILSDPARMRQILVNLVGNALKFTSKGCVEVAVRCIMDGPAGRAVIAFNVKDSGIGMTPEQIGRLFQPFAQADSSTTRQYGGTGLGLAISKRLAEALGGAIHVVSQPGEGTTFTFSMEAELPGPVHMLNDLSEAAARTTHQLQSASPAAVKLRGRVLLAEDGPDNRKLISAILRMVGAEVDLASNGRVAVEKALEALSAGAPYDAILMDMQMPEMDGYEATGKLRQSGYKGPIVALTAHAMAGDREKCLAAGCDDYATKPVDRMAMLATLARSMGSPGAAAEEIPAAAVPVPTARSTSSHQPISSAFRSDPDMAGIIAEFVGQLPQRLAEMRQAAANNQWEVLQRSAHQLKGAGRSYGYACLTDAARELESNARQQDAEAAMLVLTNLAKLCEKIQAGHAVDAATQDLRKT